MKKFLIIMLILLIIAGTVFYFGWVQFEVPPGSFGVLRSKTHGINPEIIRQGEFRWYWYKLIPSNAEVCVFTIKPVNRVLNSSGVLPSGTIYAAIAGIDADFSWSVSGEFSFSVKPEALPSLCERENISSQEDLTTLENAWSRSIEPLILNRLNALANDGNIMESLLLQGTLPELDREIEATFPDLEKISCVIRTVRYPDYTLYTSARTLFNEYVSHQQKILESNVIRNAENNIVSRLKLDELEKIGDVLTRYPVLVQFLALGRDLSSLFTYGE